MKMNIKNRYFKLVMVVIISYLAIKIIDNANNILSLVNKFTSILSPFIAAVIIAYILNPLMKFLQQKFKLTRKKSILFTYIIVVLVIVLIIRGIVPVIANSAEDIIDNVPYFTEKSRTFVENIMKDNKFLNNITTSDIQTYIPKVSNIFTMFWDTILESSLSFTKSLINIIFGLIISIYVLADKEKFIDFAKKITYGIFKKNKGNKCLTFIKNLNSTFSLYIGAKALDSLIIAIIAFIGLWLLKSKYVLLIALVVGVFNMIPYFGPFIGMTVAFIINVFYSPMTSLWVLIFLLLLQQFDGWYLDPKLTGNKVGISPFLTILAVTVGGGMFGIIGMLLGVPVMAIIKIYVEKFLKNHNFER